MWIFGYGSLMWDDWEKEFNGSKIPNATLENYSRAFNKKSVRNWGSRKNPGPTLGLEPNKDSKCIGCAFKIPDENKEKALEYLKGREGKSFELTQVEIELPSGAKVDAFTPINDPRKSTYIKNKDVTEIAEMVRNAEGKDGKCFNYVKNIHAQLEEMSIEDRSVNKLWSLLSKGE